MRATASGRRTETAGQTGQGLSLYNIGTLRVMPASNISIRFSGFKMLSNNYGNAVKEGEDDVLAVCVKMGEA